MKLQKLSSTGGGSTLEVVANSPRQEVALLSKWLQTLLDRRWLYSRSGCKLSSTGGGSTRELVQLSSTGGGSTLEVVPISSTGGGSALELVPLSSTGGDSTLELVPLFSTRGSTLLNRKSHHDMQKLIRLKPRTEI